MSIAPIENDDEEESSAYNFRELLDLLNESKDIILTIPADQLEELKVGLRTRKAKDNYGMKRRGIPPPQDALHFTDYPSKDDAGTEIEWQRCVRVKLVPRKTVDILKVEIPSDDL